MDIVLIRGGDLVDPVGHTVEKVDLLLKRER
jgi:hypothetical protein